MGSVQKSLRMPLDTVRSIAALAEAANRDFSSTTNELLEEALRMRRCPGILFTSGPAGRRATIAGSGIDVWEIIAKLKLLGGGTSPSCDVTTAGCRRPSSAPRSATTSSTLGRSIGVSSRRRR